MGALVRRRSLLWPGFIVVHLVLAAVCLAPGPTGASFNDVTGFYRVWVDNAIHGYGWPAIDAPWVYPIVALVPMLIPRIAGDAGYGALWVLLVSLLNAAAFAALIGRPTAPRVRAAWYWLLALLALGPVSLGRLDIVSVALAILAIVAVATRPWLAGVLLALGTWVKFWPAALIVAFVVASKERWKVLVGALGTSIVVIAGALWLLHARYLFSFVGQQSGRGLQIESVFASPLLWAMRAGVPGLHIYYDTKIYTFQIAGPGASVLAAAANWALPIAVIGTVLLGAYATLRKGEPVYVTVLLALALTVGFCVFDKVGSPQYQSWFPVPVMLGLMVAGRRFRVPAVLVMISLFLTQLIYPWFYDGLTGGKLAMIAAVTVRNGLDLAIFCWAVVALVRAAGRRGRPVKGQLA